MNPTKIVLAIALTGFVFGVLGFVYIMGNAWFHPQTLAWPLTHFRPYPREDTFGACCFATALVSFFVYNILKPGK